MTKQESDKKYRDANKEKIAANKKLYRIKNKEKIAEYERLRKESKKKYRYKQTTEYNSSYYKSNKEKIKLKRKLNRDNANKRIQERKVTEPLFKLKTNIRSLIRETIKNKGNKKSIKSEQILGCNYEQFKLHLESQFESWMSWDNYGNPKDGIFELNKTWDIDHIIPIKTAETEEDVIKLNHYTNLRPLCSYYNRFIKR